MIAAIVLFLVGACAGVILAVRHFLRRGLPPWIAVLHGLVGATGFGLLLWFCLREPTFVPTRSALILLVIAIALGCVNVVYHLRRIRHRTVFIVAHAVAAVSGVATLAYGALTHDDWVAAQRVRPADPATPSVTRAEEVAQLTKPADTTIPAAAVPTAAVATEELRPHRRPGWAWTDRSIRFNQASTSPTAASRGDIAFIADELKKDPDIRLIEVQGHSDERGNDASNLELARARARAVADALVAKGVSASRLRAVGYGARCPSQEVCRRPSSAPNACHEESAWQQDRRVALLVIESSGERFSGAVACDRAADLVPVEDARYASAASGSHR
jgi:outer membrane protein OmpA-like peptidoglycan-associated protein